ncbi:MAG TPA: hypothetical protein VEY91_13070 [Candidatus Limnocylindria bacterium]|nr:hypothetical protein [Candidatus Limnocylindria bacterium]
MTGSAVGLLIGDRIVAGAGYSFAQSVYVNVLTVAGALIGWSIALSIEPSRNEEAAYLGATSLRAIVGYAAGVRLQAKGGRPDRLSSLRFGIEPRRVMVERGRTALVPHLTVTQPLP